MSVCFPILSNPLSPSDADLLLYAQYMADIAKGCDLHAKPGQPDSPWETIGYMRAASRTLAQWLIVRVERDVARGERLADELRERLQLEARDDILERWSNFDRDTGIRKSGPL